MSSGTIPSLGSARQQATKQGRSRIEHVHVMNTADDTRATDFRPRFMGAA
jgi:hypothetical protein